ncbi:caspase-14 isoform X2 [Heterocephalus glaber]|uniref:Caspase-14 isoform X2 n=1 Tax=Heterocephalus glaber TaxID=10181 RepID=A0AAX6QMC3_HETGA|nr:caspase-14 isoform X2 [Heterocephalus glaber]
MAFLVSGTLQVAAQLADAQDSLGRKGKYSMHGSWVALTLSSPRVSATTVAALDHVFQALGFENHKKNEVSVQGIVEELIQFQDQLDAQGGPVSCALAALVAPSRQLRQPLPLVQELSRCEALQGCPKVFLLLSSDPGGNRDAGVEPPALPWYWHWFCAPRATPSQAAVLQIHVHTRGQQAGV